LIRKEAIEVCLGEIKNKPIISANGFISRDLFNVKDKKTNFYMIGSMGLASSIGLGIALKKPSKKIFVFDGDGNILMNLGSLATIGKTKPKNLIHIIFDNSIHESTGSQPTGSDLIPIEKIAKACNYQYIFKISTRLEILKIFKKIKKFPGPILILIKIDKGNSIGNRISRTPKYIKEEFMKNI
jgi:Thiamine pyrophosphate-requiring enzymes [acetolactate synthase, pyruvate dehydrogenase (cytochrome), glyoxylate carboligase, phosphonopyruvate decarboxylase]